MHCGEIIPRRLTKFINAIDHSKKKGESKSFGLIRLFFANTEADSKFDDSEDGSFHTITDP